MIELRDLEPGDCGRLYAWRREPDVDLWMDKDPPADMVVHEAWFADVIDNPDRRGWIILQDGVAVGYMSMAGLLSRQRRGQWSWYIGEPEARGKGAGRAAQALGLDHAFSTGLRKVWSEVLAENEVALKAQAAAGFRREGYMRSHAYKNAEAHDVVLLAIFAEEWAARRPAVRKGLIASGLISG